MKPSLISAGVLIRTPPFFIGLEVSAQWCQIPGRISEFLPASALWFVKTSRASKSFLPVIRQNHDLLLKQRLASQHLHSFSATNSSHVPPPQVVSSFL
ncbi:MAG: hypothetical protein ABSG40_11030, partial [Terriglobales bacterium]